MSKKIKVEIKGNTAEFDLADTRCATILSCSKSSHKSVFIAKCDISRLKDLYADTQKSTILNNCNCRLYMKTKKGEQKCLNK
jgi:hypothetical protein